MPRVTPFLPPASSSAAVGVDVASSGDGDDDDDSDDVRDGDDVAVVDEDGVSSALPLSSWSPPSDMADDRRSLVGLSPPDVWEESTSLRVFYLRSHSPLMFAGFGLPFSSPRPMSSCGL